MHTIILLLSCCLPTRPLPSNNKGDTYVGSQELGGTHVQTYRHTESKVISLAFFHFLKMEKVGYKTTLSFPLCTDYINVFPFECWILDSKINFLKQVNLFTDCTLLVIVNYFLFNSSSALNSSRIKICPALANIDGLWNVCVRCSYRIEVVIVTLSCGAILSHKVVIIHAWHSCTTNIYCPSKFGKWFLSVWSEVCAASYEVYI
jgi:hypothetical protein